MGGEGRGRSGDKPCRWVWRRGRWVESEMRDSYSVITTPETGRSEGWRDTSPEEAGPPPEFILQPAAAAVGFLSQ